MKKGKTRKRRWVKQEPPPNAISKKEMPKPEEEGAEKRSEKKTKVEKRLAQLLESQ